LDGGVFLPDLPRLWSIWKRNLSQPVDARRDASNVRRLAPQIGLPANLHVLAQMLMHTHQQHYSFIPDWSSTASRRSVAAAGRSAADQLEERIGNQSFLAGPRPTSPIARSLPLIDAVFSRIRLLLPRALPAAAAPGTKAVPGASKPPR